MADKTTDNDPFVQRNSDATNPVRPSWETVAAPSRPVRHPGVSASPPLAGSWPTPPQSLPVPPPSAAPSLAMPVMPPEAPNVRYDLAGNPIFSQPLSEPASGLGSAPYAPPVPFGYSAGPAPRAAPGVWPPPPVSGPVSIRNNSGEQSHLPPEIERLRWHWGAFFFPILWTKKHGLTTVAAMLAGGLFLLRMLRIVFSLISPLAFLGICIFYGVAYFGLQVYLGLNGHKIGWRNRHFSGGIEEYFKVQNAWMWWGFGINIALGIVLPVLLAFGVIGASLLGTHSRNSYGSGSYSSPGHASGNFYGASQ